MIAKIISPGDRLELRSTVSVVLPDGTEGVKTYQSSVYDILPDGKLEFVMPMEQQRLVLLPIKGEYSVCFFTKGGTYKANVRIVDRQKVNNVYILIVEMITSIHKFQRREYYRFNCMMEMKARELSDDEIWAFKVGSLDSISEWGMRAGVIVDISGGGLRFVSKAAYPRDGMIVVEFTLPANHANKVYRLAAKVVWSGEIAGRQDDYENRVMYEFIGNNTREEIIRYIFDSERQSRKNGKV